MVAALVLSGLRLVLTIKEQSWSQHECASASEICQDDVIVCLFGDVNVAKFEIKAVNSVHGLQFIPLWD
mgnify:FL=1